MRAATCGNLRDDGGGVARAAAGEMSAILQFRTARWIYRDERLSPKSYAWPFGVCVALFSWPFAFPLAVERYSHGPLWIGVPLAVLLVLAIVGMFLFGWGCGGTGRSSRCRASGQSGFGFSRILGAMRTSVSESGSQWAYGRKVAGEAERGRAH